MNTSKTTLAIDCEMVETIDNAHALARVSIVDYNGGVLYDKFVKPESHIVNFRTFVSGVKPSHMKTAVPFKQARKHVLDVLKGQILVGHSLKNDFKALEYVHEKETTRDTSTFHRFKDNNCPMSLKRLADRELGLSIQNGAHSSVEDARVALMLYKKYRKEWEQKLAKGQRAFNYRDIKNSLLEHIESRGTTPQKVPKLNSNSNPSQKPSNLSAPSSNNDEFDKSSTDSTSSSLNSVQIVNKKNRDNQHQKTTGNSKLKNKVAQKQKSWNRSQRKPTPHYQRNYGK